MVSVLQNGKNYSATNVTPIVLGIPVLGTTELSYNHKIKDENHYGLGAQPTSYGQGIETYDGGSITVSFDEMQQILATAPNNTIINIPPSTITVVFDGLGVLHTVHKILNVRFTEDPFTVKSGDTIMYCKIPFNFAGLDKSGGT